ncbi:MAG: hypothetical protein K2N34_15640 [Lachnospiraceae bacterium]|nr:hypothetical protein [Lachnospiraceae bacterium]
MIKNIEYKSAMNVGISYKMFPLLIRNLLFAGNALERKRRSYGIQTI